MKKLSSLSIMFPFFNDEGTVTRQIELGYLVGTKYAQKLEVIALHGGNSKDQTYAQIKKMKKLYPKLKVINKSKNKEGYAVIKHGLRIAQNDWIFYTDGDAQYHLEEDLPKLIEKHWKTNADVVNGYKKKRYDNLLRIVLGSLYALFAQKIFQLPIRDVDCDFRLIRKKFLDTIELQSHDSSILPELVKKLQLSGAKFAEIPVSHYHRSYGKSNYTILTLAKEKLISDIRLYASLRKSSQKNEKIASKI